MSAGTLPELRAVAPETIDVPFAGSAVGAVWAELREIPEGLPPVAPFSGKLLPRALRPWIEDIAERIQCPPDFPAVAATVALASVVGRSVLLRPGRRDDWEVVPNLWGAIVGRPGVLKSPAIAQALRPLRRLEVEVAEEHERAARFADALEMVREVKRTTTGKKEIEKALRLGRTPEEIAAEFAGDGAEAPPARRRFVVNDTTHERLGVILAANPRGVLVFRDELSGWLRTLDKEGREDARAFWLETWNGDGRYEVNRIGRGDTIIENAATSVLGGIQPGPLGAYLAAAAEGGGGADGLMQRFQLAVWPDVDADWRHVDRWPDTGARRTAFDVFARLAALNTDAANAERCGEFEGEDEKGATPFLRLDDAAYEAFNDWRTDLERRVRAGTEHAALESHFAKYRSMVPALALVLHLADGGRETVGLPALLRALAWAAYLETHARRLYDPIIGADRKAALALAGRIRAGTVKDNFTARDIYRHEWSGLATPPEVDAAVRVLIEHGWLREEVQGTGGRPRTAYRINPALGGAT